MRVICSLAPDAVVALLPPELIADLKLFRNLDATEDVFDYLWDDPDSVDIVVINDYESIKNELHLTASRRPGTRFIVIGHHEPSVGALAENIVFSAGLDDLRQTITLILNSRNTATPMET